MKLEQITKREVREGVLCVSDRCIQRKDFETPGEFCSECECGFPPDQLDAEEINSARMKVGQNKLEN